MKLEEDTYTQLAAAVWTKPYVNICRCLPQIMYLCTAMMQAQPQTLHHNHQAVKSMQGSLISGSIETMVSFVPGLCNCQLPCLQGPSLLLNQSRLTQIGQTNTRSCATYPHLCISLDRMDSLALVTTLSHCASVLVSAWSADARG